MEPRDIESLEIKLLLEAIMTRYGYDFSHYSKASFKRRLDYIKAELGMKHYSDIIPKLLHDQDLFRRFVIKLSVPVTEMFRDPGFFIAFREQVIPVLKTYPFIKMWIAGCSTGEEVYSFVILFKEAGLLERTHFYATDINDDALKVATKGIYKAKNIKDYSVNYKKFSNQSSFSEYYHAKYESVIIRNDLRKHVTFANHNLVSDHHFGEMNVISCRNVMIYFDRELQNNVLTKFRDSLISRGFLCLGNKESLINSSVTREFETISQKQKIYRLKSAWQYEV